MSSIMTICPCVWWQCVICSVWGFVCWGDVDARRRQDLCYTRDPVHASPLLGLTAHYFTQYCIHTVFNISHNNTLDTHILCYDIVCCIDQDFGLCLSTRLSEVVCSVLKESTTPRAARTLPINTTLLSLFYVTINTHRSQYIALY